MQQDTPDDTNVNTTPGEFEHVQPTPVWNNNKTMLSIEQIDNQHMFNSTETEMKSTIK